MKMRRLVSAAIISIPAVLTLPYARASVDVMEMPVSFSVVNTNTSKVPCESDGKPYQLIGTLVAPAQALAAGNIDSVTLYLHGSGNGETWHFTAVPGYDHITEMAKLGHASVFLHSLGYGSSDPADGRQVCFGSLADLTHQVIAALRAGAYEANGVPGPKYPRVALAGHSAGGLLAESEIISYHDVDALVVADWADYPLNAFFYPAMGRAGARCSYGGEAKQPGGPRGWTYVFSGADFDELTFNIDPAVRGAFVSLYEKDACGFITSGIQSAALNVVGAPKVSVPVLLIYGDHDVFLAGSGLAAETMRARYALGSDDVSVAILADTGHGPMLERTAGAFRSALSTWLKARGF